MVVARRIAFISLIILIAILLNRKERVVEVTASTPQTIVKFIERPVYIQEPTPPINAQLLGDFTVTYYTAGPESTGKRPGDPDYGITFSGAHVEEGVTVAVDPDVIPLGSYLYIEGIGFRVAQDIGSAIKGNDVDVYVPDVKTALKGGRHPAKVYLIKEGSNDRNYRDQHVHDVKTASNELGQDR